MTGLQWPTRFALALQSFTLLAKLRQQSAWGAGFRFPIGENLGGLLTALQELGEQLQGPWGGGQALQLRPARGGLQPPSPGLGERSGGTSGFCTHVITLSQGCVRFRIFSFSVSLSRSPREKFGGRSRFKSRMRSHGVR